MPRADSTDSGTGTEQPQLQAALAAEHAAVYGYGVVGAYLARNRRETARTCYDAHRAQRDLLRGLLLERRCEPVTAAPAYGLPFQVTDGTDAVRLAAHLENGLAAVYADLVAVADRRLRTVGAEGLRDSAVRASQWSGESTAFPGLPERATGGADRSHRDTRHDQAGPR